MKRWGLPLLAATLSFLEPVILQLPPLQRPTAAQLTQLASLSARDCDISAISFRVDLLNDRCDGDSCSIDCAVNLVPLLAECRDMFDALYPRQGSALDSALDSCLSISSHDALQRLIELHNNGQCPNSVLNSIAEAEVESGVCADTLDNCVDLMGMGLSCDNLVGQCDVTCNVCHAQVCEDTNENCAVMLGMGLGCESLTGTCDLTCGICAHRRAQDVTQCDFAAMQANIQEINTNCCDETSGVCDSGVPATCDAKCAVFFVPFYSSCRRAIGIDQAPDIMDGLDHLLSTCDEQLPVEGLLTVAAECTLQSFSNGFIFTVGGVGEETEEDQAPVLDSAEKYDLGLGQWFSAGAMTVPRKDFAVAVANGRVYALGGMSTHGYLNTVESLDPSTGIWTEENPMATNRAYLAAVVADGLIYALGGIDQMVRVQKSVETMDLATGIWGTAPDMLVERYGLAAAATNGYIFAVAGYQHGQYINLVEAFELATQTWNYIAPLATARIGLAAAIVNNHLIAYGGYNSGNGGQQLAVTESLDLSTITDCVDDDATMGAASGCVCNSCH